MQNIIVTRFKGTHSYRNIAGLTENKLVRTITDSGCTFVKPFKVFGEKNEDEDDEEIDDEEDEFQILHLDSDEEKNNEESEDDIELPKHLRYATHTLNLIATTDYKNTVRSIPAIRTREKDASSKAAQLWKKFNKPKSN
ncbi:uncharacterized protein [Leptinotarsa decemlineata]|uniref:uncharacterized protein n=1 Tax=Leptinotarsa decemlineata TaxID=7539 RepID=UPI003D30AFE7